jgi:hypothetical protein
VTAAIAWHHARHPGVHVGTENAGGITLTIENGAP